MKTKEDPFGDLPVRCIRFGAISGLLGENAECRIMFVCKKDKFDYIGQISISPEQIFIEMFNSKFLSLFRETRTEVEMELQKAVLEKLSQFKSVPNAIRSLARSKLEVLTNSLVSGESSEDSVNLEKIFNQLNRDYFGNQVEWGKGYGKNNRRSIRYGSYEKESGKIWINPVLARSFVPRFVLELTVYHEMCHHFLPPIRKKGRWFVHHREFKIKEREYRHYEESIAWESENWTRLLRS